MFYCVLRNSLDCDRHRVSYHSLQLNVSLIILKSSQKFYSINLKYIGFLGTILDDFSQVIFNRHKTTL